MMTPIDDDAPAPGGPQQALSRGAQALRAGRLSEAERWLDRAWRLAPGDAAAGLLLASALLRHDPPRAIRVLQAVLAQHPQGGDVHIALAAACRQAGSTPQQVAGLLAAILARRAAPRSAAFRGFADRVATEADEAGWAGADAAGRLVISLRAAPGHRPAAIRIGQDDQACSLAQTRRVATHRLQPPWSGAACLDVTCEGRPLLGSPLDLRALRRVEGMVRADADGGVSGCAWVAGDPDAVPSLRVMTGPQARVLSPRGMASGFAGIPAFARRFRIPPDPADPMTPLRVVDDQGCDLPGSPILRGPLPPAALAAPPPDRVPQQVGVDVVIPVWQGVDDLVACLASLRRGLARGTRIVIVDDASPDARLQDFLAGPMLGEAIGTGEAIVLHQARRGGFPAAANAGLRFAAAAAAPRDVLLLNPDTMLPQAVLARLAAAAYADAATGSVTPLSDDGSIVACDLAPLLDAQAGLDGATGQAAVDRIDAWCAAANPAGRETIPTGVGFCLYLRHDCLAATGLLREDAFAQGYGEENDWCSRAAAAGWRHVTATGLFVAHAGGRSFGAARALLMARNGAVLDRLHPHYAAQVRAFRAADPLRPARRRAAALAWAEGRAAAGAAILVSHALGGGTEQRVLQRAGELATQGLRAIVLRLMPGAEGGPEGGPEGGAGLAGAQRCTVADGPRPASAELTFQLPGELPALADLLRRDDPHWLELHHGGGLAPDILDLCGVLGIPYDVAVHDYAMLCPRVTFCDADGRYCGEPTEIARCATCVATHGSRLHEAIAVPELRRRSARILRDARQVLVPCEDVGRRLRRYVPDLTPMVTAWEAPRPAAPASAPVAVLAAAAVAAPGQHSTICIVGAIGRDKGYDVLLRCAEDAARHDRALRFTVVGHTIDDARLLATGRVFVTGRFDADEAEALVRAQGAALGFVPSVCPETWSFALSTLWQAGLAVLGFDLGAPAERIRSSGHGRVVPLGTPAARLNALLLEFAAAARRPAGMPPEAAVRYPEAA